VTTVLTIIAVLGLVGILLLLAFATSKGTDRMAEEARRAGDSSAAERNGR
jgi:hypothetical protein